jgi:leucyl/phenylalanyl-tRNA--protein transferase
MAGLKFPNPRFAGPDGLVAIGGNLETETIINAYKDGIFPWPMSEEYPLLWFCPQERGVLYLKDLKISKRLERKLKNTDFTFTVNKDFESVIRGCSNRDDTWITDEMMETYIRLNNEGYAHSVECWLDEKLAGGIYGVLIEGIFSAESMFYNVTDASKAALIHLIELLKASGHDWVDIQMMTPHMESLGATGVQRDDFLKLLKSSQNPDRKLANKVNI